MPSSSAMASHALPPRSSRCTALARSVLRTCPTPPPSCPWATLAWLHRVPDRGLGCGKLSSTRFKTKASMSKSSAPTVVVGAKCATQRASARMARRGRRPTDLDTMGNPSNDYMQTTCVSKQESERVRTKYSKSISKHESEFTDTHFNYNSSCVCHTHLYI
jgi:hypothetical protein